MDWSRATFSSWRTGIAVAFAVLMSWGGISQAAERVTLGDYMTPNGEGSSWIYSRSGKANAATRITVVEDHYLFQLPIGSVFTSQKLEEHGTWKNGRFVAHKGAKREALFTYTGTEDRYRLYGMDEPVPGSRGETKSRLRFDKGFNVGPTMKIGEKARQRTLVYRGNKQLGYTICTTELVEKARVKVPAGTFQDCIRLRFTLGVDAEAEIAEEWWAKGVGLVKWKGIAGASAGVSEALVAMDLQEVIPYVPPGLALTGEHLSSSRKGSFALAFPPVFIPGTLLEETVVLKNTGSETLKGVRAKLIANPHFKMDPFETRDLAAGESVTLTVRLLIPAGSFEAMTQLEIKTDDRTVEPSTIWMTLSHWL